MKVRIVPHAGYGGNTWWKVQVKSILLRILFFRVYHWRTVGDYSRFLSAKAVAKEVLENESCSSGSTTGEPLTITVVDFQRKLLQKRFLKTRRNLERR